MQRDASSEDQDDAEVSEALLPFIWWMDQCKNLSSTLITATAFLFLLACDRGVLWVNKFDTRIFQMGVKGGGHNSRSYFFFRNKSVSLIAGCRNIQCVWRFTTSFQHIFLTSHWLVIRNPNLDTTLFLFHFKYDVYTTQTSACIPCSCLQV